MISEVKYNGYSASPSDYESIDGDLAAVVNMIPEDGALHPIAPPKVVFSLGAGQNVVLLHETSSYSHYIVQDASNKLYWRTEGNSTLHSIHSFGSTKINDIISIGNTIVALCEDGINYILWDGNTQGYKYLGNQIPECPISFGLQGVPVRYSDLSTNDTKNGKFTIEYESMNVSANTKFSEENKRTITAQVLAKVNKFIAEVSTGDNKFIYPFFVRYAYRLYDNTLTRHSAPILMLPTTNVNPIVSGTVGQTSAELDVYAIATSLDYRPLITEAQKTALKDWGDIVKSVDIFISAPLYTYDQSGECESLTGHQISDNNFYGKWKTDRYEIWPTHYRLAEEYLAEYTTGTCIALPSYTQSELDSKIRDCGEFYLLTSIEIKDLPISSSERPLVPIEEGILSSIVTREVMKDDYQSNDILAPSFAQAYNSRLNIANIERRIFNGYDLASMCCYIQPKTASYIMATHTKVASDKDIIVERISVERTPDYSSGYVYLFYPDVAAKSITLFNSASTDDVYRVCNLSEHAMLNGAVHYQGLNPKDAWQSGYTTPTITDNPTIKVPNKIYTSEVNNPFSFPLLGINTIGTGEIIGISTAAKALSEGQFGQFPLYAFTTDGVWALEVSATGSYSAKQPITRDVCLDGRSITQIDDAVLFATARGIMLISGSESICITDILDAEQPFLISQLPSAQKFVENVASLSMDNVNYLPFQTFLTGCRMMYDYIKQRIFVFNPSCRYAYVYSLESKAWGIVASNITSSINSYPEPLAMTRDNKMVNMSLSEYVTGIPCLLVTRPLSLDARDALKTIDTIIQRGFFKKGDVKVALYGSRDLRSWFMVYSSTDHYLRGFRGTPYKFYRIAVSASLGLTDTITGCTTQFELRQMNQPR